LLCAGLVGDWLEVVVASDAGVTVFRGGRVFDGERVAALTVAVASGVIAAVGEAVEVPQRAVVIDTTGMTILPGLIDAHTHVFAGSLGQAAVFGVTTELDMFADPVLVATLKREAAARDDLADLRSAGTGATAPGGHPTGLVARGIYRAFPTIEDPGRAEEFVTARLADGSDYLKIIIDDGRVLGYPHPSLSPDTVRALVAAAHWHGLLAVVHTLDAAAADLAVRSGADGLAHLPVDADPGTGFANALAGRGVFVTPTLTALEAVCGRGCGPTLATDPRFAPWLDSQSTMMLTMMGGNFPLGAGAHVDYAATIATLGALHRAGVEILAGTDAGTLGVAHGASMHRELQLLVEAGLAPVEALTAATSAPADRFRLTDRGRIRPGLAADLLLVDGDPATDITATANIVGVWRNGTRIDRGGPAPGSRRSPSPTASAWTT